MNPASHRPPSLSELQRQVELFNRMAPSGSAVTVRKDSGEIVGTKTRSEAWVLSGHSAVVLLDGISGGYDLNRISLIPIEKVRADKLNRAEGGKSDSDRERGRCSATGESPAHPEAKDRSSQAPPTSENYSTGGKA